MIFTKTHKNYKYNCKNEGGKRKFYGKINSGKTFLLCFRQAAVMDDCGGGKGNSAVKFVKMDNKDGGVIFSKMYPVLLSQPSSSPSVEKDAADNRKKKAHKKFLRLVKAVLFETALAKKIRRKAAIKKLKRSKASDPSTKAENESKPEKKKSLHKNFVNKSGEKFISNSSSVNSCTRLSSTSCASSKNSTKSKESNDDGRLSVGPSNKTMESKKRETVEIVQENGTAYCGCNNTVLLLLAVTLLVLIFWGKLYAILCTSTWLFFIPNWNSRRMFVKKVDNFPTMGLENKKKIIMDGILERNKSRVA